MAECEPRRIADNHIRPAACRRVRQGTRQVAGDVGPDRVPLATPQPVKGDVCPAEIADGQLLFFRNIGAVMLLSNAMECGLHLRSRKRGLFQRSGTHSLDRPVEERRVPAEGFRKASCSRPLPFSFVFGPVPAGGGGTRIVSSFPAMNSEIESCIASPR